MEEPEITVLMAVYNAASHLREAVESILSQTFAGFEFLVIDDGSTDSSKEIVLSYKDPRIRLLSNEKNTGLTASLNKGLREATGKYIARMDADDLSLSQRLEIQYKILQDNPDVGVVTGWVQVIDEQGNNLREWSTPLKPEDIYYKLNFRNCLAHSAVMFHRDLILKSRGYNENIKRAQDFELWHRLSKVTKICQVDRLLLKWRDYEKNISYKWKTEQEKIVTDLVKPGLESLAGMKISEKETGLLQTGEIDNISDLQKTILLLEKINKNLLLKEAHIIRNTGLKKRKIKKAMQDKIRKLLYSFFRNLSFNRFLYYFMNLRFRSKILLLKEIVSGVKRKIIT